MKKIAAIIVFACIGTAAVAQASPNESSPPLATSLVSSSAKITATDVVINPNPVKGQNFSLELQNLEKGKYTICIFDKEGKKYLLKTLNTEGSSTETIGLPKQAVPGTYILQVLSKSARFSKKMVIE